MLLIERDLHMDTQTDGQGDFIIPVLMFVYLFVIIQANVSQELDSGFISLQLKIVHAMHDAYEERCPQISNLF